MLDPDSEIWVSKCYSAVFTEPNSVIIQNHCYLNCLPQIQYTVEKTDFLYYCPVSRLLIGCDIRKGFQFIWLAFLAAEYIGISANKHQGY